MPQLSDLMEKKKFVKKSYRPWDLSGVGTIDGQHEIATTTTEPTLSAVITSQSNSLEKEAELKKESTIKALPAFINEITDNITGNNTGNIQTTTREHIGNNRITRQKQPTNNQITYKQHVANDLDNITGNTTDISYLTESIKKLTGIQKSIFLYIINVCSARGALDTGNILSSDCASIANCSIGSAKTSLNRLVDKHLVVRYQGKACRGGHMVLGITNEIQSAAIQAQQALFNPFKSINTNNITSNVMGNNSLYSSSILNKNINTTILPDEWKKINFESLRKIGFSETQLRQLLEAETTTYEIVQDSIHHFSFALERNDKVKAYSDPLNVFMGVLRKGQRWHEPAYIPQKEITLRQILSEKKQKKEQLDLIIKELIEIEFPAWKKKLTPDEIKLIVPEDMLKTNLTPAIHSVLRGYYTEKILLPRLEAEGINIDVI